MDEETREALKGAIAKWQRTVDNGGRHVPIACPLCTLFEDSDCVGCPVYEFTERYQCENTPYWGWVRARPGAEKIAAAKKELEFLKGLLTREY